MIVAFGRSTSVTHGEGTKGRSRPYRQEMLAPITAALDRFETSMTDSDNLVSIHRELGQGVGRRTREIALNRSIVVLSVAAWQAFVQDLTSAALAHLSPPAGAPRHDYNVLKATTTKAVFDFATPNAENSRALLLRVGFDPWSSWAWQEGPVAVSTATSQERLNKWLKVRHAIAHGHEDWPDVDVLSELPGNRRTLRLANCERAMGFFRRLTNATATALDGAL